MRIWLGLVCSISVWGAGVTTEQVRDAATRAIGAMQSSQKNWYATQNCVSCHHQFLPAMAYRSAREHGIPVDETIAHADAVKTFDYTDLDQAVQYTYVIEPAMTDAFQLVAAEGAGIEPNLVTQVYARLIAGRQNADGSWDSFHQRPPSSYSRFTQTAFAAAAIQMYSHSSQADNVKIRVRRAREWLLAHQPRDTEERAFQMLGLCLTGGQRESVGKMTIDLMGLQQADGGWASLDGRASDAYSTGEALFGLSIGGVPVEDPHWQRGIEFLVKTQAPDGTWHVPTRLHPPAPLSPPYFESGYPYGHDQFLSMSGASWAAMALANAAGGGPKSGQPEWHVDNVAHVEPWAETMLFGSVADVQRLIDNGFDANSATKGGTTALMMAAPDTGKLKLLLDHGAKINARSQAGYTALMVAAQYRESTAAINLLLDRGAEVRPPAGAPAAKFNAFPLFLAAYAGNPEVLGRLHNAGDLVDDKMILIGTSSATPLTGAVRFGNLEVARTLLGLGAKVDQGDGADMTPLDRAVLGNQVETAKLLIEQGADVNHKDKLGMTPLLYAASIDFGDSAMIELLLASGAKADTRTREGKTALDLAREYGHTHLLGSLRPR